jgi:hypothetical protein
MIVPRADIQALTGYVRASAQARWLQRWGIEFTQNMLGEPLVREDQYLAGLARQIVPGIPPGEETPAQIRAYRRCNRRERLISQCTPHWANREAIEQYYALARMRTAETGVRHAVDHIVPINGRKVSGLHVETNLQVISHSENSRKGNRWP